MIYLILGLVGGNGIEEQMGATSDSSNLFVVGCSTGASIPINGRVPHTLLNLSWGNFLYERRMCLACA